MAKFNPQQIDLSMINGGNRYENGDGVSAETINRVLEASALAQYIGINPPDTTEANRVGIPEVTIKDNRLVFKNLKGAQGEKGATGERGASGTSAVLENENHNSDIDGYTQNFVNSNFSNPNLLINGDFRINQRGQTSYSGSNKYTVDRWKTDALASIVNVNSDCSITVGISGATTAGPRNPFTQPIEDFEKLKGQTVTFSIKYSDLVEDISKSVRIAINDGVSASVKTLTSSSGIVSVTRTISENATRVMVSVTGNSSAINYSLKLYYAKLEIGSVATALSPRPYAEELALCQRYFQKYIYEIADIVGFGITFNSPEAVVLQFHLVAPLRTAPTITSSGTFECKYVNISDTGNITSFSDGSYNSPSNTITISITVEGNIVGAVSHYVVYGLWPNSSISFDAEIYN